MRRKTAASIAEICSRHACVVRGGMGILPHIDPAPYETAAFTTLVPSPVSVSLTAALIEIRNSYEIVEAYVRPYGAEAFEPLCAEHLALENAHWVLVACRRHPSGSSRVIGIMLAKDEADAIPEVIASLDKQLDTLYYLAGDDATAQAIVASSRTSWARAIANPGLPHADGLRHFLLEQARADAITDNDPRPLWIVNIQGDEIYHDSLQHHIRLATAERATVFNAHVATFLLHESQREGWDWSQPLATRLNHYIWDYGEHAGFLDFPWIYYTPSEHMRAHPHGMYPAKWATAWPIRKHYPFRSPEQAKARIEDRLCPSVTLPHGSQPHYENYRNIFMGDKAADRDVKRYHGWFPELQRTEGVW